MPGFWNSAKLLAIGVGLATVGLTGCVGDPNAVKETRSGASGDRNHRDGIQGLGGRNREQGTIFGPGGLFGTRAEKQIDNGVGVAVNAYLWRASLDTINFIPLVSADPFGGVIITDWRIDPNAPTERFKMTVYILDTRLRADGVKVNVFKQVNGVNGWVDAQVDPDTPLQIENAILTRARQLRLSTLGEN